MDEFRTLVRVTTQGPSKPIKGLATYNKTRFGYSRRIPGNLIRLYNADDLMFRIARKGLAYDGGSQKTPGRIEEDVLYIARTISAHAIYYGHLRLLCWACDGFDYGIIPQDTLERVTPTTSASVARWLLQSEYVDEDIFHMVDYRIDILGKVYDLLTDMPPGPFLTTLAFHADEETIERLWTRYVTLYTGAKYEISNPISIIRGLIKAGRAELVRKFLPRLETDLLEECKCIRHAVVFPSTEVLEAVLHCIPLKKTDIEDIEDIEEITKYSSDVCLCYLLENVNLAEFYSPEWICSSLCGASSTAVSTLTRIMPITDTEGLKEMWSKIARSERVETVLIRTFRDSHWLHRFADEIINCKVKEVAEAYWDVIVQHETPSPQRIQQLFNRVYHSMHANVAGIEFLLGKGASWHQKAVGKLGSSPMSDDVWLELLRKRILPYNRKSCVNHFNYIDSPRALITLEFLNSKQKISAYRD